MHIPRAKEIDGLVFFEVVEGAEKDHIALFQLRVILSFLQTVQIHVCLIVAAAFAEREQPKTALQHFAVSREAPPCHEKAPLLSRFALAVLR